ncbi:MAG: hypothetical protein KJ737_25995 [Proteobacteria bacterium]|nr:hypothetical protein [Pseudomonadota bacterium]
MAARDIGGIRVEDGTSGERAQTIEAVEQHGGNPTVIQSVLLTDRRINSNTPDIIRSGIYSDDTVDDLDASPPHTPVSCGDKKTLIVQVVTSDSLNITPVGYNSAGDNATILFDQKPPTSPGNGSFRKSSKEETLMEVLTWDILGAEKIAIAITGVGKGVDLRAWLI